MPDYTYLIIGGGMTADAAVKGIRSIDASGTIAVISNEGAPPYKRPPLSKALWKGEPLESVHLGTGGHLADIFLSRNVTTLDLARKVAGDDQGLTYAYQKLLLATGGAVRTLQVSAGGIIYYRTLDDYQKLRALADQKQTFAVIGGGFIGSEIGAALAMNGKKVVMVFPDDGIGSRVYPKRLSDFLNGYYRSKGVELRTGENVADVRQEGEGYAISTTAGKFPADVVVAGVGIKPNVALAEDAGLTVENGIVVNEFLQTSARNVYAAGDVANFFNPALGKRLRVEHEDNALAMGDRAGRNMAGEAVAYTHLPFFYSDLFDLGYEAVGEIDARLTTVEDWKEEFREGVVYYLDGGGRVRGVLLWNTWGQVENARSLISQTGPFTQESLKGRLPA